MGLSEQRILEAICEEEGESCPTLESALEPKLKRYNTFFMPKFRFDRSKDLFDFLLETDQDAESAFRRKNES